MWAGSSSVAGRERLEKGPLKKHERMDYHWGRECEIYLSSERTGTRTGSHELGETGTGRGGGKGGIITLPTHPFL